MYVCQSVSSFSVKCVKTTHTSIYLLILISIFFKECKILKNRKVLGTLHEQFVRQKAKPRIVEVEADKEEK